MAEGTLTVNAKKQIRVKFKNSKDKEVEMAVPAAELSPQLKQEPVEKLNGRQVELDEEKGQPKRVRPVGELVAAAPVVQPQRPQPQQQRGQQGRRPQGQPRRQDQGTRATEPAFHNPYNFVPALPRDHVTGELADREPLGHHVFHADQFSGVMRVKMTIQTPLLLPDAAKCIDYDQDQPALGIKIGHKSFPLRIDGDGKPYVPPTSIKGMLRSAYEAVTNSRLAVFSGHEDRLAYRMPARDGLAVVPARVVAVGGTEMIELLPGESGISGSGRPTDNDPMYAAWLPRYDRQTGRIAQFAVRYPDSSLPQHRDAVEVWLELWERTGQHLFRYWSVRKCVRAGQSLGTQPQAGQRRGTHQPVQGTDMISVRGFICVTNRNIDRKHDERTFFTTRDSPVYHSLTEGLRQQWRELIRNYQAVHQAERDADKTGPPALNNSIWSRQVVGGEGERNLAEGTLCYAAFYEGTVTALYPVMISRRLFEYSPLSLLSESLLPAYWIDKLSPADRVFGWVRQSDPQLEKTRTNLNERIRAIKSYRGNLRIGPVTCESNAPIEWFNSYGRNLQPQEARVEPGLPLAILGQPKPQQGRFYVAASLRNGEAQADGLCKEEVGYRLGKGLRGRKVYPHQQALPNGHWDQPMTDRTQQAINTHFQEYRRPHEAEIEQVQEGNRIVTRPIVNSDGSFRLREGDEQEQRDNQNRSIQGWVKPGTVFTFDLHVTNLSKVELGALLWLLSLKENRFHRFGGGKPLGFGSVRLEVESSKLHDGNGWKPVYSTLEDAAPSEADCTALIEAFEQAVRTSYGEAASVENVPFIAAWLRMATGHPDSRPTHYPRARQPRQTGAVPPNPEGLAYEWFAANDREERGQVVEGHSLPNLALDAGLPMIDAPRRGN